MPNPQAPLQDDEQMVTAERSMFGTRLPRPTGVGRHLIVVGLVFVVALGLAIAFAESAPPPGKAPDPAPSAPAP